MKLLALDTSSVQTGYSYYVNGKYYESGIINLSKIKILDTRINNMINSIKDLLDKYKPDHVVIEDIVVERNWHTFKVLALIIGSLYGLCIDKEISYSYLSPTQWRNIIDSNPKPRKREELKKWGIEKAKLVTNKELNDDEADAILLGKAYCIFKNLK